MAPIARVRDPEFFREQGIGFEETVIVAWVALHVRGGRHVARHALIARDARGVVGMRDRIDDGCVVPRRRAVALETQRVILRGQLRQAAMGVVAVKAGHTRLAAHATGEK